MKKRILALTLALILTLALLPQAVPPAADAASNSCGKNLTWSFNSKTGTLTISGSGDMQNYAYPASPLGETVPWYRYAPKIKTVQLPDGLTSIGDCSFVDCTALKRLELPDSVTRIGVFAFEGCTALQEVRFSAKLKSVDLMAFSNCTALTEALLPAAVTHVGYAAFSGCKSLRRLVCLNAKVSIGVAVAANDETNEDLNVVSEPAAVRGVTVGPRTTGEDDTKEDLLFIDDDAEKTLGVPSQTMLFGKSKTGKVFQLPANGLYIEKAAYLQSYAKTYRYTFYPVDKVVDVKDGDPCQIPVAWAVGNKVTAGMDATHFAPASTVTRAQAMTFFWAAKDRPKFKKANTQFVDVKKTDWFYKSVMWAVENGVTAGTDATHFSPNKTCNRGEILAVLYAALKKPKVKISNPYKDVTNQWYKKAALWAYANGIEKGDNGKFNASTPCTRASVVTYLYRFMTGCGLMK